jgi:hypothetical protein
VSLFDLMIGAMPDKYDPDDDALARPDPMELKSHSFHVRQDATRYAVAMAAISRIERDGAATRRLLVVIIGLLVANKVIDIGVIAGLLGQ